MEKYTTRTITANAQIALTDQVVLCNATSPINIVIPDSPGDGTQLFIKNISENDVTIQINGLQDLTVPRLPTGINKTLSRLASVHLLASSAGNWIMI
jgi:hypothetical protein